MPDLSMRDMKAKREQAADWITWASWAAIASAVWSGITVILAFVVWETPPSREEYPLFFGLACAAFVQGLAGWSMGKTRNQWSAWVLMTFYVLGLVLSFLQGGFSNVPMRIGFGVIYVLGFMGTVQYAEMDQAIHEHAARPYSPDAPTAG